jgi:hypothetical protein
MSSTADNDSASQDGEYFSDDQNHGSATANANGDEFSGSEDGDGDEWEDESSSVSDGETLDHGNNVFTPVAGRGCAHYSRGCRLVSPCCGLEFWCRFCHNEYYEADSRIANRHILDRWLKYFFCCSALLRKNSYKSALTLTKSATCAIQLFALAMQIHNLPSKRLC